MPALTPISINDGASTPVAHVFSPVTTDGKLALLQEKVGVPKGFPSLSIECRQPVSNNGIYRVTAKLQIPTTGLDSAGATVVRYVRSATISLVIPDQTTQQERKDLRVLLSNLMLNASFTTVVESPEPIW